VKGDVFGLAQHSTPPFVLSRGQTTLGALEQRAGPK
jgi:hypothetical protein